MELQKQNGVRCRGLKVRAMVKGWIWILAMDNDGLIGSSLDLHMYPVENEGEEKLCGFWNGFIGGEEGTDRSFRSKKGFLL